VERRRRISPGGVPAFRVGSFAKGRSTLCRSVTYCDSAILRERASSTPDPRPRLAAREILPRMADRGRGQFVTTRWSVVLAAGADASSVGAHEALASLCETYWYPLYAFLRSRGYDTEDAQDLTQAFFARLLEKHAINQADPARGRFRSFLLASLKHFAANEHDRDMATKRGGGALPCDVA